MKKKLLAVAVLVICLSIISAGTWAHFTAEGRATNVITTGSVDIEVIERADGVEFDPDEGMPASYTGIMPGTSASKEVTVKNTGSGDAYVRVWVNAAISEAGDPISNPTIKNLPLTIEVDGNSVDVLSFDWNTADWYLAEDGYWYYRNPLAVGVESSALFENVSFAAGMGNEYQNCKAIIDVQAFAVQFDNQNVQNPWDALGWPEN